MENIGQVRKLLSIPKDIVITSHRNPDGDAIGSSLALYLYLLKLGHTVKVIFPSEYPHFVSWMPDAHKILIHDIEPDESNEFINRADIIFCLDYNALERIDKMGEVIAPLKSFKIMIDHHLNPDYFADYILSEPEASSTCELIYDFLAQMDELDKLDVEIGECLLSGILTDTGSFKYATSSKLFRIVSDLLRLGVDDYKVQDLIFNSLNEKHLRLLGHCLRNRMEILDEYQTGIIWLNRRDYEYYDIQRGDTEGIVNYLLKMRKVKVAAFITEQPTIVKISLRSKGDFSVEQIAKKHFKGGGHKNAAGGSSYKGLHSTLNEFKDIIQGYKEEILA